MNSTSHTATTTAKYLPDWVYELTPDKNQPRGFLKYIRQKFVNESGISEISDVPVSITSGTNVLTSASALFESSMIGLDVVIIGAGAGSPPTDLNTRIKKFNSTTQVKLEANAGNTVTSQLAFQYETSIEPASLDMSVPLSERQNLFINTPVFGEQVLASLTTEEIEGVDKLIRRGITGDRGVNYLRENLLLDHFNYMIDGSPSFLIAYNRVISKPAAPIETLRSSVGMTADKNRVDNFAWSLVDDTYRDWLLASLKNQNLRNESNYVHNLVPTAEAVAAQDYIDSEAVRKAGLYMRQYNQLVKEDEYRVWFERQSNRLQYFYLLCNALQTLNGTEVTRTSTYYKPPLLGTLLGIGATIGGLGMQAYGMFGGGSMLSSGALKGEKMNPLLG